MNKSRLAIGTFLIVCMVHVSVAVYGCSSGAGAKPSTDASLDTLPIADALPPVVVGCWPEAGAAVSWPPAAGPLPSSCPRGVVREAITCRFWPRERADCTPEHIAQLATCFDCLVRPADADASGPIVVVGSIAHLNVSACIIASVSRASPDHVAACTTALDIAEQCAATVCQQCQATAADYESCLQIAGATSCAAEHAQALAACADLKEVGAADCMRPGSFDTLAERFGTLSCSTPSDGGAD